MNMAMPLLISGGCFSCTCEAVGPVLFVHEVPLITTLAGEYTPKIKPVVRRSVFVQAAFKKCGDFRLCRSCEGSRSVRQNVVTFVYVDRVKDPTPCGKKYLEPVVPEPHPERIFGASVLRYKYHFIRERMAANDPSLQVEDVKELTMFSWLLPLDEVNQVLEFREDSRMLILKDRDGQWRPVGLPSTRMITRRNSGNQRFARTTWRLTT